MSHLPTTSLPADERFETRAPESFVDENALAPLISSVVLPWQDRSYDGEDFAGRDDLGSQARRTAFPSSPLLAHDPHDPTSENASPSPLIIAAPKARRFALLRKIGYWLAIALLLAYIALCLTAATYPELLSPVPAWWPQELFPFLP
jgi:hypothetical protein